MAVNEGRAHFTLAGYNFSPNDVTELLGIEPTSSNAAGTNRGMIDNPSISTWIVSTEKFSDDIDVFAITRSLVKIVEPVKDKIKIATERFNLVPKIKIELLISVDKNENVPEVGFGSRTITFLSEVGAFIEVDYQLSERV